jgi:SAM-dependent methyltransferase
MKAPPHESPLHAAGHEVLLPPAQHPALRPAGIWKRLFAFMLARGASPYEEAVAAYKQRLLGELRGTVVEIGAGAGKNLHYLPRDSRYIGYEPNPHFHPYLRAEAERLGRAVEIRRGVVEQLDLPDDSADAVVSTLVLCSVLDLRGALREIRRILRPGGRLVFIEHVAAPQGTRLRRWQGRLAGIWRHAGDGCQLTRETWRDIEQGQFGGVHIEHFRARIPVPLVAPHIAGYAVKK